MIRLLSVGSTYLCWQSRIILLLLLGATLLLL